MPRVAALFIACTVLVTIVAGALLITGVETVQRLPGWFWPIRERGGIEIGLIVGVAFALPFVVELCTRDDVASSTRPVVAALVVLIVFGFALQHGLALAETRGLARIIQCAVKGADLQWVRFPPGNWSLQPVAIGAVMEVTKWLKHSGVEGRLGRLGERAGRNASERRAGLEKGNVEADPPELRGRPPPLASSPARAIGQSDRTQRFRRGNGYGMHVHGDLTQHGEPDTAEGRDLQPDAREGQAGPCRVAERPVWCAGQRMSQEG